MYYHDPMIILYIYLYIHTRIYVEEIHSQSFCIICFYIQRIAYDSKLPERLKIIFSFLIVQSVPSFGPLPETRSFLVNPWNPSQITDPLTLGRVQRRFYTLTECVFPGIPITARLRFNKTYQNRPPKIKLFPTSRRAPMIF